MPQISVIVPIYNVEQYLDRCVESVLVQTFRDFELILVDDGSLDNCPQICEKWANKDDRIRVIHKINEGVSIARNVALNIAKGEYITFCDSDDYLDKDYLEILYNAMISNRADAVSVKYSVVDENNVFVKVPKREFGLVETIDPEKKFEYIYKYIFGMKHGWEVWTRLFRADIIQNNHIRFPTCCANYGEDLGFVLEYSLYAERAYSVDYAGYNYMLRSNSMMRSSEAIVKFDQMNNLSEWFYPLFMKTFSNSSCRDDYPIIHFLFMNIEYGKIIGSENYCHMGKYISNIKNIEWYESQIKKIRKCKKSLIKYFGKRVAGQILLLSHYCKHKNWKRFTYESFVAYKILPLEQKASDAK